MHQLWTEVRLGLVSARVVVSRRGYGRPDAELRASRHRVWPRSCSSGRPPDVKAACGVPNRHDRPTPHGASFGGRLLPDHEGIPDRLRQGSWGHEVHAPTLRQVGSAASANHALGPSLYFFRVIAITSVSVSPSTTSSFAFFAIREKLMRICASSSSLNSSRSRSELRAPFLARISSSSFT